MKSSLSQIIDRIRSLSLFVGQDSPHLIYRLEAAEKLESDDPGFHSFLVKLCEALHVDRTPKKSDIVDIWALDLWEYNQSEYDYFSEHPEEFTGFSECGIARILSHVAMTLDFGGPMYVFVMYNMSTQRLDIRDEIAKEDYPRLLEALPF